jgi:predicted Fe-Mo cluster-binding NifX family protein
MKIACPSKNNIIDDHFGHCDHFTIFTVSLEDQQILGSEVVTSPKGCGCKSDIASTLAQKGVSLMLAGNMGAGAVSKLAASGIDVIRGCSGDLKDVTHSWLRGQLKDTSINCTAHECKS